MSELYGLSATSVYRALNDLLKPHTVHRFDHGQPRVLPRQEMERYCELVAALKFRTTIKKGRHLSTRRAIQLLEDYGVDTGQGHIQVPKGVLTRSALNRYLSGRHLDQPRLHRGPPAVRFLAEHSNDCWQFDMSPSDLKHIDVTEWVDPDKGEPPLMLSSVVDDRNGVACQEYHGVYGEDAGSALRFLYAAMAPKNAPVFPLQGRPKLLYLDNGPVAKSRVCQDVMLSLGVDWLTHLPAGDDHAS